MGAGVVGGFVVLDKGKWLTGDAEAAKAEVSGLMDGTNVPTGCAGDAPQTLTAWNVCSAESLPVLDKVIPSYNAQAVSGTKQLPGWVYRYRWLE